MGYIHALLRYIYQYHVTMMVCIISCFLTGVVYTCTYLFSMPLTDLARHLHGPRRLSQSSSVVSMSFSSNRRCLLSLLSPSDLMCFLFITYANTAAQALRCMGYPYIFYRYRLLHYYRYSPYIALLFAFSGTAVQSCCYQYTPGIPSINSICHRRSSH